MLTFSLKWVNEIEQKNIEKLKEILGEDVVFLKNGKWLVIDDQQLIAKKKRGAGAKETSIINPATNDEVLLSEVEEMLEISTGQKVADYLGIDRTTLYRRLKKARKLRDEYESNNF